MAILQEYHCPSTFDEALQLLRRRDVLLQPLAGGSWLVGQLETRAVPEVDGVVDLRNLGLDTIHVSPEQIRIGAMVPLAVIEAHPQIRELAQGLLVKAAQGEGPINLRNAATIGGTVAMARYDSEFYAALLALEATVLFHPAAPRSDSDDSLQQVPLALYAPVSHPRGDLIVGIEIPRRAVRGGYARVARTPSDRPIVAALAVVDQGQPETAPRVALCGVAACPVLADSTLDPPANFKGSASYRRAMARVVTGRALAQIQGTGEAT